MHHLQLDLTPGELKILEQMVRGPLMDFQGMGILSDQDDDDLTSLNTKLLKEINNNR